MNFFTVVMMSLIIAVTQYLQSEFEIISLQVIRGRLCLQLTDKVLLPATISYVDDGQRSVSWGSDDTTQPSDPCTSELTAEATLSDVKYTATADTDNDDDDDSKVGQADSITWSVAVSDTAVHTVTATDSVDALEPSSEFSQVSVHPAGSVKADEPSSESIQGGPHPADITSTQSVMTVSVVDFPSDGSVCNAVHLSPASVLLSAVHVGDTLLHSVKTDADITESEAEATASDCQPASCSGEDLTKGAVSDHDDSSEIQHLAKWTRSVLHYQFFS